MSSQGFEVRCFGCAAVYDGLEAVLCSCLVPTRTLVCPHCLSCFCKAPHRIREEFWAAAPESVWATRNESHHRPAEVLSRAATDPARVKRPLVMIVDDDAEMQRLSAEAVEELGYGFLVAADGDAGLALARRFLPDLILTDALMPKLDGREMCRRLKEDPATSHIKVVIMTGLYTAQRYRSEGVTRFHADDYLTKPLEFRDLRTMLQKHVG